MTYKKDLFAEIWNKAEEVSSKQYKDKTTKTITSEIIEILLEYENAEEVVIPELKSTMQNRQLGLILYLITALSARSGTNVFPALQDQIKINELI